MSDGCYLLIVDQRDLTSERVEMSVATQDFVGWNELARGWSLGSAGSDAVVRIDEISLDDAQLGLVRASNHVILAGTLNPDASPPDVDRIEQYLGNSGEVYVRFDRSPLRIGRFTIQFFDSLEL